MEELAKYWPLILPLVLVQLVLMVTALVDLSKRQETRGPRWIWILVIVFGEILGPVVYFVWGRKEE